MRKIMILSFITLDGVMQAPGGKGEDPSGGFDYEGWAVPHFDEIIFNEMDRQMSPPFDLLLGRKTYDIFAAHWPSHRTGSSLSAPDEPPGPPLRYAPPPSALRRSGSCQATRDA